MVIALWKGQGSVGGVNIFYLVLSWMEQGCILMSELRTKVGILEDLVTMIMVYLEAAYEGNDQA